MQTHKDKVKGRSVSKRKQRGETLVEVLVALLIAAPCMTMIAGAITTSAKINSSMEKKGTQIQKALPMMNVSDSTSVSANVTLSADGTPNVVFADNETDGTQGDKTVKSYNDGGNSIFYFFEQ